MPRRAALYAAKQTSRNGSPATGVQVAAPEVPMRFSLSSNCLAIALADERGTLRLVERASRFEGETFIAIEDEKGVIEVAVDMAEAEARVAALRARAAA